MNPNDYLDHNPIQWVYDLADEDEALQYGAHKPLRRGTLVRLFDWTKHPGQCGVVVGSDYCPVDRFSGIEDVMYKVLVAGETHMFVRDDLEIVDYG